MKRTHHFISSFATLLIAILLFLAMLFALISIVPKLWRGFVTFQDLKEEYNNAIKDESILSDEIKMIADQRGMEEVLRNRFNVGKEGESLFIVLEDETSETEMENIRLFDKVKKYLGFVFFWN